MKNWNWTFFSENGKKSFPFRSSCNVFTNVKYSHNLVPLLTLSQFILVSVKWEKSSFEMKSEKFHLENSERKCQIWKFHLFSKCLLFQSNQHYRLCLTSEFIPDMSQLYFQPPTYFVRKKIKISAVPQISFTLTVLSELYCLNTVK